MSPSKPVLQSVAIGTQEQLYNDTLHSINVRDLNWSKTDLCLQLKKKFRTSQYKTRVGFYLKGDFHKDFKSKDNRQRHLTQSMGRVSQRGVLVC